jgi:predicted phage baseplate assembly protein
LDDRSFNDILEEALRRIPVYTPEWTDHNLSDPGITLIELFSWMTDIVLYRLNRVPDRHYVKFMELVGMRLREAEPARAPVTFWLSAPQPINITIPEGTAVSTTRTETEAAIVFTTDTDATIYKPTLSYVMTSVAASNERRRFNNQDIRQLTAGSAEFAMFESEPPSAEDGLYFGFEEDLSNHLLGIEIEVNLAEGAGIDPTNLPYVWEVLGSGDEQDWARAEVEYDGTLGFNLSGLVRLLLPQMARSSRNNQTAYWLRCRLMSAEESNNAPLYQVSPKIRKLKAENWGIIINTTNVTTIRGEVLGRSDGSPGQRFYMAYTPVVPRSPGEYLIVRHDDNTEERWEEVADFASSKPDDPHYTIDSMTGEVRLAPALPQPDGSINRFGRVPPKNAMLIMRAYRYGGGRAGNVGARALNVLKSALPYVDHVTNRQAAQGGLDAENLEDAKTRLPGYLRSLGRAVTATDYEYLAYEAAPGEIGRTHCLQAPVTNAGEVRLLVIPHVPYMQGYIAPESLRLSPEVREQVTTYLDERRLLGTKLDVGEPNYVWVQTEVHFHPAIKSDPETVKRAVEGHLFDFLNPLVGGIDGTGWQFGRGLFVADIIAMLLKVPGVDFVRSVKLFPINYEHGEAFMGGEMQEIPVPPDGVIASFDHTIVAE